MKNQLAIDAVGNAVDLIAADDLTAARQDALSKLRQHGLPSTAHEDWKYTDLGAVIDISNEWLAASPQPSPVPDLSVENITSQFDADWLIIRNGVVDAASLAAFDQSGIETRLLADEDLAGDKESPLSELNVALLQNGLSITVPSATSHERIIGILVIDNAIENVGVTQARVKIDMRENSSASFIEYHASAGTAAHYANSVVDIDLGEYAIANYVRIQNRHSRHSQTGRLNASLGKNSQFHHAAFDFGGDLIRNDLDIKINGRQSLTTFFGLYLAGDKQHIDNHTRVDHLVGPADSQQEYRGILSDAARCIWNGKAVVHKGADGTDANQANHNLLLSEKAEIDAKPELEIYADDVKCSHGTTIGQLDETALFYLKTRGIDDSAARQLLTRAFAQKIVAMSPIREIQEIISEQVAAQVARLITRADV